MVTWRDCIVWCNAYSEATGKTPVYYKDTAYTIVLRKSETSGEASAGNGEAEKAYTKVAANGFRLPTEAQWEYAARGGDQSDSAWAYIYAGSNTVNDVAWYKDNAGNTTHPVKTKQPNSLALYDMSGNVWEWCWDVSYDTDRVLRGGSLFDSATGSKDTCLLENRGHYNPDGCLPHDGVSRMGFRVVLP
jgi:formylglycine-generating enzyme required for sulfatase activity